MLGAIRLVNNVGHNLPVAIRADLHIKLFHMFKSIQDQIKSINDTFRTILQTQITQNLQLLDQQDKDKSGSNIATEQTGEDKSGVDIEAE